MHPCKRGSNPQTPCQPRCPRSHAQMGPKPRGQNRYKSTPPSHGTILCPLHTLRIQESSVAQALESPDPGSSHCFGPEYPDSHRPLRHHRAKQRPCLLRVFICRSCTQKTPYMASNLSKNNLQTYRSYCSTVILTSLASTSFSIIEGSNSGLSNTP